MALGVRPCRWRAVVEDGREEGPYVGVYLEATMRREFL